LIHRYIDSTDMRQAALMYAALRYAVGQFQIANGYADYLVLQFNLVNFKGKDYQISAIALDPDTTLGGMATEVDQRYFTRVILPAAAGFLQGFGQALGQGSSTTTTNGTSTIISQSSQGYRQGMFRGLNAAANTASQFFQNQANQVKPLVRVAAGTPIGIFFITSVLDNTAYQQQHPPYNPAMAYGYPGAGALGGLGGLGGLAGYPGIGAAPSLTGSAYPGTTVAGFGSSSGVPYPNYANPSVPDNYGNAYGASPYSALPSGLGTTYYGR
ncbi:MAG: DotG/IcmE/VirB10 family protein, partial [Alphaproteobacteria bacterium]